VYSQLEFELDGGQKMKSRSLCAIIQICWMFATVLLGGPLSAQTVVKNGPAMVLWRPLAPSIQKMLEDNDENCVGAPPAGIVDAFGMSSDALSVALVDFCGRGAYTDSIVAIRLDHGKLVLAKFRDTKGKIVEKEFVSGASAINTADVKLVAEKKAIYDLFAQNDSTGKLATCGVKAYVWNAKTETFDLDLRLSKTSSSEYCHNLRGQ
jgi:hypothetical protein